MSHIAIKTQISSGDTVQYCIVQRILRKTRIFCFIFAALVSHTRSKAMSKGITYINSKDKDCQCTHVKHTYPYQVKFEFCGGGGTRTIFSKAYFRKSVIQLHCVQVHVYLSLLTNGRVITRKKKLFLIEKGDSFFFQPIFDSLKNNVRSVHLRHKMNRLRLSWFYCIISLHMSDMCLLALGNVWGKFHMQQNRQQNRQQKQCVYLLSCSPFLNPIKECWAKIKAGCRRERLLQDETITQRIIESASLVFH